MKYIFMKTGLHKLEDTKLINKKNHVTS